MRNVWIIQYKGDETFSILFKEIKDKLYRYEIITPEGFKQLCKDFELTCGWEIEPSEEQMVNMDNLIKIPFP